MGSVETLAGGLFGLIVAAGVGWGFMRLLGPIPDRWRLAVSLLSGVALIDLAVMLVLFLGGGVGAVKVVGMGAVVIGLGGLLALRQNLSPFTQLKMAIHPDRWFVAVIVVACALNLFIAIAPSTKIDELHYHMLIPNESFLMAGSISTVNRLRRRSFRKPPFNWGSRPNMPPDSPRRATL